MWCVFIVDGKESFRVEIKEEKEYEYPTKDEIIKSMDMLWENNDIQMIFWKKYFKNLKGDE